jgi:hypothetical protein
VAKRLGMLCLLLSRRSGLSIRNGVLLYKQLIRPMMDYACPVWRSAARSHVRKLQVLQFKCLRTTTNASWYVGNKQIHEDLGIPFFADYIRTLTESFDSKLTDAGNPLVRQLGRHLLLPRVVLKSVTVNRRGRMYSRPVEATPTRRSSRRNVQYPTPLGHPEVFRVFPQL